VRTRGFWLSLATVPLILLISLAIPIASDLTRPELDFAVTDRSGWVLEAVVRRADAADLQRLLARNAERDRPEPAQRLLEAWAAGSNGTLEARIADLLEAPAEGPELDFLSWWRSLAPAEMARLDADAWRARFRLVHDPRRWVPPREARANLDAARIFAWIEIPEDPVGRPDAPPAATRYAATNLTNRDLREWFAPQLDAVVGAQRRREADVPERLWRWLAADTELELRTVDAGGAARPAQTRDLLLQWGPVAFVYVLWISIQVVTQMLLSSTVEEKSGRLVEVLLAATGPLPIMAGKVLGIAAIGLVIVGTWLGTLVVAALGLPLLLGLPAAAGFVDLATNPLYLGSFLVYYLLGYLFYAALLCGLGSLCTSLREAQTLAIPVQSALFLPLLAMVPIARDPSGTLAVVLTWLPPFTPFVMMNRAAQPPALEVYLGTTLLMVLAVALAAVVGARLFRIGVLTSGQAPTLPGVLRLLLRGAPTGGGP
ncbi:MAG: ABC transporter permease, partial [Pseudomonadales bacterium]|jgi:ABC-2 type transport system permease protein|nr:ABC transporter permease [Pseudomonadales bacterium]